MRYADTLYGEFEVPEYIGRLMETETMTRLNHVLQDMLPHGVMPWQVPSRFEHCVGVMRLAMEVVKHNPRLADHEPLLLVSALLHDAGNPAFSHLSEPFLKHLTGKDGESFLATLLLGSKAEQVIRSVGLNLEKVVQMVTGDAPPLSIVLNGSLDVDNVDNVVRYQKAVDGKVPYDGLRLASRFRFVNDVWVLPEKARPDVRDWQTARRRVYATVYGNPHLTACMMLYRSVALAVEAGEVDESFFRLTDMEAMNFLIDANSDSALLAQLVLDRQFYEQLICVETTTPSVNFAEAVNDWNARHKLADSICTVLKLPRAGICTYVGRGRDSRRCKLPFVGYDGQASYDVSDQTPLYRLRVYADPSLKVDHDVVDELIIRGYGFRK